jgi:hypothetical protein
MKRLTSIVIAVLAFAFIAGGATAFAQGTFKIPFKFQAGGKKFAAGDYWIAPKDDKQLAIRPLAGGDEVLIPFTERLAQPQPAVEEPRIVFDMVGTFEPSYTEYFTDYVVAEFWLPGQDGYLVKLMKGAHQHQVLKGQLAKK